MEWEVLRHGVGGMGGRGWGIGWEGLRHGVGGGEAWGGRGEAWSGKGWGIGWEG